MPLLARIDELASLIREYEAAQLGHGRVVIIAGEPGSGKSTLLRRFLGRIEPDARTFTSRGFEGDVTVPYALWFSLLSGYPHLRALVPPPLGDAEPPALNVADLSRRVSSAFVELARDQHVVLAFDDVDFADESSLAVIRTVAQRIEYAPILIILVVSTPTPPRVEVTNWLRVVAAETNAEWIELQPIDAAAIRSVIDDDLAEVPLDRRDPLAKLLTRLSGGNLLLLNELLSAVEAGEIDPESRDLDHQIQLPTSLFKVVEQLASRLSGRALETLSLAAVAGDVIDLDMLVELRGLSVDDIVLDLEEALALGLLSDDDSDEIHFRHGAFRQSLAEQLSPLRRRRLHAAILTWLLARPSVRQADVAIHAERAGDLATAYTALTQAARDAESAFALPEAAHLYRRALNLSERLKVDPVEQDQLRLALADVLVWNDRREAWQQIHRVITRASVRNDGTTLGQALQRKSVMLYEDGHVTESLSTLDQALPVLEVAGDSESLATALTYAGYCFSSMNIFPRLRDIANHLNGLADVAGQPAYRAIALQFEAVALVAEGHPHGASDMMLESIEIMAELKQFDRAADYAAVAFMRVYLLANLHEPGRVDSLVRRGEELARLRNRRLGLEDIPEPAFAFGHFLRGEWDQLRQALGTVNRVFDSIPVVVRDIAQNAAAELALGEGQLDVAESISHTIAPSPIAGSGEHSYQQWLFAVERLIDLRLRVGDIGGAQAWIEALDRALSERPHVPGELLLLLSQARLAIATQDYSLALEILDEVRTRAEETTNMLVLIHALQLMADANRLSGDLDAALAASNEAVAQAERCRLPYEVALSRLHRAEVWRLMPGTDAALRDDLGAARATFEQLGARAALRRLEDLEREAGRRDRASRLSRPAGLTEREVDVVRLIAKGLSDRQIAEQLYISPRTVTTHVGNLLGKTMTANRTELALWAVQQGLAERE